jgi:hypothetical protein
MKPGVELYASFQLLDPQAAGRVYRSGDVIHHPRSRDDILSKLNERGLTVEIEESLIGYSGSKSGVACPYLMIRARKT